MRVANCFWPTIAVVADTGFHGFAAAVLAVRQHLRQGFAVMLVLWVADYAHYDVGLGCGGNGNFVAVFVGFVVLAFADAVHTGFMERVNLVVVFRVLVQNPFVKQEVFLVAFEHGVTWQCPAQFTNQCMGNGTQPF